MSHVPGRPFEPLEQRLVYAALASVDAGPTVASVTTLAEEWSSEAWASDTSAARDRFGLYGFGQTVAIIDSGIAYDHLALGQGLGTNFRVVGGWDFAENDADPYDDGPLGFHGTHVAGIVGSSDIVHTGVAPGVDLVALRVFDDYGSGETEWIASALWWVHEHQFDYEYPITTVNLSLGIDDADPVLAASIDNALQTLKHDGIFISVSAGNDFDGSTQLKNPATSEHVVPVASVGDSGLLSDFSQRNSRILAAPGEMITSTAPDYIYSFNGVTDDFISASGTSMSAPHVAGASVLLREVFTNLGETQTTQAELYNHFLQTADTIDDLVTQQSYRRVNLSAAIEAAVGLDEAGATTTSASHLGTLSQQLSLGGVINELSDIDTFAFVAGTSGTVELDATWSASSTAPEMTIGGAAAVGVNEYHVHAGQEYRLTFAGAESIGSYQATLQLAQTSSTLIAAAPTSQSNETNYVWVAEQSGWYEFQIQLDEPSESNHVRIFDDDDQLVYSSSQMLTVHSAQLFVEAGAEIRIAVSGGSPNASFSATGLDFIPIGNNGPGGPQSAVNALGQFEGIAAVIFTSPDQVHQLAWASKRELAFEEVHPTLAADSAMAGTIDQPWLAAIAASMLSDAAPSAVDRSSTVRNGRLEVDDSEPTHLAEADELFASPDATVTSNLLHD